MKLLRKLKKLDKLYYTVSDIRKVDNYSDGSLYVTLSRLEKQGALIRLAPGMYVLPERFGEIEKIANIVYMPSYLSFETALSKYGILSQIPYTLTFATSRKSKNISLADYRAEYRQIRRDLYFGFIRREDGLSIASPEKALFDVLYFIARGKLDFDLSSLDIKSLDINKVMEYVNKYEHRSAGKIERILKNIR